MLRSCSVEAEITFSINTVLQAILQNTSRTVKIHFKVGDVEPKPLFLAGAVKKGAAPSSTAPALTLNV